MTRSIFDPTGKPERDGGRYTPPDADQLSEVEEQLAEQPSAEPTGIVDFQLPPKRPAIEVTPENDGKLLAIHMTGKLHQSDYERFVPVVEDAVRKHGKVRMLVELHR